MNAAEACLVGGARIPELAINSSADTSMTFSLLNCTVNGKKNLGFYLYVCVSWVFFYEHLQKTHTQVAKPVNQYKYLLSAGIKPGTCSTS